MEPLLPQEVEQATADNIPNFVIEAFNNMIIKNWGASKRANFTQDDTMTEALRIAHSRGIKIDRHEIFANKWFDVESLFEEKGWLVLYDKPACFENHAANFTFSIGK